MRRKLFVAAALATATLVGATASQAVTALSALDQDPPTLTVPRFPSFVVGSTIGPDYYVADSGPFTSGIQQSMTWSASDAAGFRSYDFAAYGLDYGVYGVGGLTLEDSQQTSYVATVGNYDDEQGGGGGRADGWVVIANDWEGNAVKRRIYGGSGNHLGVTQEDGSSKCDLGNPENNCALGLYGTLTYSGNWSVVNCSCFSAGHTRRTSSLNARVTFTRTYEDGEHVALVMATGPGRGRAAIRVDGTIVATIDTYAAVNTNRVVVFERMMPPGTHTLSITNLATSGRPRIDLDAVMSHDGW